MMIRWHGKRLERILIAGLSCAFTYAGYVAFIEAPPQVTIYAETQYPREVVRGGYFYLTYDMSYDQDCEVKTRRMIVGSDGIEYLAQEESKAVVKNDRMQYVVRVPVSDALPFGPAVVRSDLEYRCNFWTNWIVPLQRSSQGRQIRIVEDLGKIGGDWLLAKPGFIIVKSHYRRKRS